MQKRNILQTHKLNFAKHPLQREPDHLCSLELFDYSNFLAHSISRLKLKLIKLYNHMCVEFSAAFYFDLEVFEAFYCN